MISKYILLIIIINFTLYIFSHELNINRSIINIDYFLLYITTTLLYNFSIVNGKKFFSLLLILFISIDILNLLIQIFPFLYIEDFLYLPFFLIDGPNNYKIWFLSILFFTIIILFIFNNIKYIQPKKKHLILILALCFLVGESQSLNFGCDQYSKYKEIESNHKLKNDIKYKYVSEDIVKNIPYNSKKILLIVNESWGSTENKSIQRKILDPIYKNRRSYEYVSDGSFNFDGSTVSGELRELCQKYANVMNITKVKDTEFSGCLPSKLKEKSYNTYAIHGTNGKLYDRQRWYSLVGFEHILFKDDFDNARNCKTFSGKCDYDLFESIADILANNEKVFLYWLTLNTHSPYDDKLFIDGFDCVQYDIKPNSETCLNLKQQYQFFYRLSEYVQDDRMKGVDVYVVGDHAPPIMSLKDNFDTFKDSEVGWVKFKIKE